MQIIADTHVHIYPGFLSAGLFPAIIARMDALAGGEDHVNVLCLAERNDCHWFRDVRSAGTVVCDGYEIKPVPGDVSTLAAFQEGRPRLYVVAGRQVVTLERLEVLVLGCDDDMADGAPAGEVVDFVLKLGAAPVLSWAPGKWLFRRSAVVFELLEKEAPGRLLVGDSAIRPEMWREPRAMKFARDRGFMVVAGTDPLPMDGEEKYIGTYCSLMSGEFDPQRPSASIKALMLGGVAQVHSVGKRCRPIESLWRLIRHRVS